MQFCTKEFPDSKFGHGGYNVGSVKMSHLDKFLRCIFAIVLFEDFFSSRMIVCEMSQVIDSFKQNNQNFILFACSLLNFCHRILFFVIIFVSHIQDR